MKGNMNMSFDHRSASVLLGSGCAPNSRGPSSPQKHSDHGAGLDPTGH